jgi:hypothetical protein
MSDQSVEADVSDQTMVKTHFTPLPRQDLADDYYI